MKRRSIEEEAVNKDNDDYEDGVVNDLNSSMEKSTVEITNNNDNSGLPSWLANPVVVEAKSGSTSLDEIKFSLSKRMLSSLVKNDISSLFPVQSVTVPLLLRQNTFKWDLEKKDKEFLGAEAAAGKNYRNWGTGDLCVAAPTGSGKTLSFLIPILEMLWNRVVPRLRVIIILPTRDLAVQVKESFDAFISGSDLKIALICGQYSFQAERDKLYYNAQSSGDNQNEPIVPSQSKPIVRLNSSKVDVMVCTPGRLMDHLVAGLDLKHLEILVIDEADRLLSQSYQNWLPILLERIQEDQHLEPLNHSVSVSSDSNEDHHQQLPLLPSPPIPGKTRKWLFSATLTRNPEKLASLALNDPVFVHVTSGGERYSVPDTLKEYLLTCEQEEKLIALLHILVNRFSQKESKAIIFTNSVETAERLERVLSHIPEISQSFPALVYGSNGKSSRERRRLLADFEAWPDGVCHGKPIRLLICTDGMARGMDTNTPAVINYDAPGYIKGYLHRIGRCARAGNVGNAYTIVSTQEAFHFKSMLSEKSVSRPFSTISKIKMPKGNSYKSHAAVLELALSRLNNTP